MNPQISAFSFFVAAIVVSFSSLVFGQLPTNLIPSLLDLNSGWSPMSFNMTRSAWVTNSFKVIAPVPVRILYSDAFCPGKMVSIYVNGTFLMNSTQVPLNPGTCDPKFVLPAATFAFPDKFSHANFSLPVGEHSIAVKVIQYDENIPNGVMYIRALLLPAISCIKEGA